jgi:hypothetical protein
MSRPDGGFSKRCECGHPLVNHWQTGKRLCMACPDGACPDFRPAAAADRMDGRKTYFETVRSLSSDPEVHRAIDETEARGTMSRPDGERLSAMLQGERLALAQLQKGLDGLNLIARTSGISAQLARRRLAHLAHAALADEGTDG